MRALIVEDDFVSRRLIQLILSPYGQCDVAVNGQEGVDAFCRAMTEKTPYDLICLDIMMPVMDGYGTLKEIRRLEKELGIGRKAGVKVLMVSALNDPKKLMRAFKEQCDDYLIKPINKIMLLNKLKKMEILRDK